MLLVFCSASGPAISFAADETLDKQVDLLWSVKIPMRDGVKLDATVYRPHEQKRRFP